jgi:hypothetical protein
MIADFGGFGGSWELVIWLGCDLSGMEFGIDEWIFLAVLGGYCDGCNQMG